MRALYSYHADMAQNTYWQYNPNLPIYDVTASIQNQNNLLVLFQTHENSAKTTYSRCRGGHLEK